MYEFVPMSSLLVENWNVGKRTVCVTVYSWAQPVGSLALVVGAPLSVAPTSTNMELAATGFLWETTTVILLGNCFDEENSAWFYASRSNRQLAVVRMVRDPIMIPPHVNCPPFAGKSTIRYTYCTFHIQKTHDENVKKVIKLWWTSSSFCSMFFRPANR